MSRNYETARARDRINELARAMRSKSAKSDPDCAFLLCQDGTVRVIDNDDVQYIHTFIDIRERFNGDATPVEEFLTEIIERYQWSDGALTPEIAQAILEDFRYNFESTIESCRKMVETFPALIQTHQNAADVASESQETKKAPSSGKRGARKSATLDEKAQTLSGTGYQIISEPKPIRPEMPA